MTASSGCLFSLLACQASLWQCVSTTDKIQGQRLAPGSTIWDIVTLVLSIIARRCRSIGWLSKTSSTSHWRFGSLRECLDSTERIHLLSLSLCVILDLIRSAQEGKKRWMQHNASIYSCPIFCVLTQVHRLNRRFPHWHLPNMITILRTPREHHCYLVGTLHQWNTAVNDGILLIPRVWRNRRFRHLRCSILPLSMIYFAHWPSSVNNI